MAREGERPDEGMPPGELDKGPGTALEPLSEWVMVTLGEDLTDSASASVSQTFFVLLCDFGYGFRIVFGLSHRPSWCFCPVLSISVYGRSLY